jgi:predicted RNA methylase
MFSENKNINKLFWDCYYSKTNDNINLPSTFAKFIYNTYLKTDNDTGIYKKIADLGCGNCRDSCFFSSKGNECYAIDYNLFYEKEVVSNLHLFKENAINIIKHDTLKIKFDIIYMRWFLHAMLYSESYDVIKNSVNCLASDGLICIEVRSMKDRNLLENSVYDKSDKSYKTTHKRWPYTIDMLNEIAVTNELEIIYIEEDFFSLNENTETKNPLLIRTIYKKKQT